MHKIILIIGISIFGISCSEKNQDEKNVDSNKKIILEMFDAFNNHDWEKMASYYSDSAIFKDPSFGNESIVQSKTEIIEKYRELEKMFPDVKDSLINIYNAEANHVIVEFISNGSMTDNSKWYLPIATIFKIENNKIVEDFTYYNNEQ